MIGKPKFRPIITRIKLNPEQAVLTCACWTNRTSNTTHVGVRERAGVCDRTVWRTTARYSRTTNNETIS